MAGDEREDLPLGAGLGNPGAGDLRRIPDAALRARGRSAALLLVARGRRQDENRRRRIDQHRLREDEILEYQRGDALEGLAHPRRIGERVEKVPPDGVEDVERALVGRVDHLLGRQPGRVGHGMPPEPGHAPRVLLRHGHPREVGGGDRSHLGGPLHSAVAAHRHEAASLASDHPAREGEVDDRLNVLDAEPVLGEPHAPYEDGAG